MVCAALLPDCARRAISAAARSVGAHPARALPFDPERHPGATLDGVRLPSEPHLAGLVGTLLALAADEIGISRHFRADESLLEIGMDDARCLRRRIADMDRPGTHFLRPD